MEKQFSLFQEVPNTPVDTEVPCLILSGCHCQLLNTYWVMPKWCSWRWNLDLPILSWCLFHLIGSLTSYKPQLLSGSEGECSKQAMATFCACQSPPLTLPSPLALTQPISFHSSDMESVFCNLWDNSKVFSVPSSIMPFTRNNLTRIWHNCDRNFNSCLWSFLQTLQTLW